MADLKNLKYLKIFCGYADLSNIDSELLADTFCRLETLVILNHDNPINRAMSLPMEFLLAKLAQKSNLVRLHLSHIDISEIPTEEFATVACAVKTLEIINCILLDEQWQEVFKRIADQTEEKNSFRTEYPVLSMINPRVMGQFLIRFKDIYLNHCSLTTDQATEFFSLLTTRESQVKNLRLIVGNSEDSNQLNAVDSKLMAAGLNSLEKFEFEMYSFIYSFGPGPIQLEELFNMMHLAGTNLKRISLPPSDISQVDAKTIA